jgi:hypothetical protein
MEVTVKNVMRWLLLGGCTLLLAGAAPATNAPETGVPLQRFGAPIKVKKATELAQLAKDPARFAGRRIRIEGKVKDVCQGRGCWVEVEAGGASFLARSLDETVLLPKDCKGRLIVVQGLVRVLPRAAKEEAQAAGDSHACPKPEWVLATQGVELRGEATRQ